MCFTSACLAFSLLICNCKSMPMPMLCSGVDKGILDDEQT